MDFASFLSNYGLIILLVGLLVFMFWSSRRRMQKQKAEQEEKARQTVPGSEVLLQGGLYGTIVSYDADNLDQPAIVELAPGVQIKVHSQAILRIVNPTVGAVLGLRLEDDLRAALEVERQRGRPGALSEHVHAERVDAEQERRDREESGQRAPCMPDGG